MRALQLDAPKQWQRVEVDEPRRPAAGETLLRVRRVGVCGTDIGGYLGKMPFFSYPRIPGHELGVEVLEVGEGVTHLRPGELCAVEPYLNCQTCYACRRGLTNCCEHNKTLGVMCDGGLTDRLVLPARKVHPAPGLSPDQAALVETLAIGCHAVDRSGAKPGENVLVIGAGPIGLSALEFVKLSGARPIVADLSEYRLRFVRERMGVPDTVAFGGGEDDMRRVLDLTGGDRADVVIDATGHHGSMVRSFEFAASGGRVVYVGITQQNIEFSQAPIFHRRELSVLASRNALPRDFARIIALIGAGEIETGPWITHHADFEDVPQRFPDWLSPEANVLKAIIHVD